MPPVLFFSIVFTKESVIFLVITLHTLLYKPIEQFIFSVNFVAIATGLLNKKFYLE